MNVITDMPKRDKQLEKLLIDNPNAAANIAKMTGLLQKRNDRIEAIDSVEEEINDYNYSDVVSLDRTLKLFEKQKDNFNVPPDIKTFMDIAGYAYREDAANRILRFLLDPKEPHGFGNILTRALYDLYLKYKSKNKIKDLKNHIDESTIIQNVHREYSHGECRKRMDIVIEAEEHVIGIEIKIKEPANNPFSEYSKMMETLAFNSKRDYLCFLLTLNDRQKEIPGFIPITYQELFTEATKYFNELSIHSANNHFIYLHLFYDLFNTMDNHVKNQHPEDKFEKFLQGDKERSAQIVFLMNQLIKYGEVIIDGVKDSLNNIYKKENIKRDIYIYDGLYIIGHEISISYIGHLAIETFLNLSSGKWQINLKGRNTTKIKAMVNKLSMKNEPGYQKIIENEEKGEHFNIHKIWDYADRQRVFSVKPEMSGNNVYIVMDVIGNKEKDVELLAGILKEMINKLLS